jgi:hypothetical protein
LPGSARGRGMGIGTGPVHKPHRSPPIALRAVFRSRAAPNVRAPTPRRQRDWPDPLSCFAVR